MTMALDAVRAVPDEQHAIRTQEHEEPGQTCPLASEAALVFGSSRG
jgi:hypothetical protein